MANMSLHRALLEPRSVALIGASDGGGIAGAVTANLLAGKPVVSVFPVRWGSSAAQHDGWFNSLAEVAATPDLAVICAPADSVAEAFEQSGRKGVKTAVIVTADADGPGPGTRLKTALLKLARELGCRFLGPGSAGIIVPSIGLNASWIDSPPSPGKLALISRSGAMVASVAGWAASRGIGVSRIVATGDEADIAIDEMLTLLATDTQTTGVLLHLDALANGRAFVTAARGAARIKPILVLKPRGGVSEQPIDQDAVYDAVFRRAGLLRVCDTEEWFEAAESLSRARARRGGKLAIVANGKGPASLAAAPAAAEGLLASFQDKTISALHTLSSASAAAGNPVLLGREATAEHYAGVLAAMHDDANIAAVLVVHSPSPGEAGAPVARAIADAARRSTLQVSACWFGAARDHEARAAFAGSKVALYDLPENGVRAFSNFERYRRNQETLRQVPAVRRRQLLGAVPGSPSGGTSSPHALMLTDETESAAFLAAYGMIWRAIETEPAALGEAESVAVLRAFGFRVSERTEGALPFSLSVYNDHVFGRIILISAAGRRAVALPPLNKELAEPLAADAHCAVVTATGVDLGIDAIQDCAIRLANLTVDVPEVVSIELRVAGVEDGELLVRPVRICVAVPEHADAHLSIHPYPREHEERIRLKGGREVVVRPIRIEDIRLYHEMLSQIPKNELFLRFCNQFGDIAQAIPTEMLANLTHFDYSRDMTFIAISGDSAGAPEALGVVDAFPAPGRDQAEYSILIRSDMAGTGLGKALMTKIIGYCRVQGVASMFGLVLRTNERMLGLCERLGFVRMADEDDEDMVKVVLSI